MNPLTQAESFLNRVEQLFTFDAFLACEIPVEYVVVNSGLVASDGTKTWCMPWIEFSDNSKIFYDGIRYQEWIVTEPCVPLAPGEEGPQQVSIGLTSGFED